VREKLLLLLLLLLVVVVLLLFFFSSSSSMPLQSNADLHFLKGLLLVNCFFYFIFQFLILHLLISVCTKFRHLCLVVLLVDFPGDYY